jgi:hypothetical protein
MYATAQYAGQLLGNGQAQSIARWAFYMVIDLPEPFENVLLAFVGNADTGIFNIKVDFFFFLV